MIGTLASYSGGDPTVVRMQTSNGQCQVFLQEGQLNDDEENHLTETVDIFAIGSQKFLDGQAKAGSVYTNHDGAVVTFADSDNGEAPFNNPVVFAQIATFNGGQQAFAKVENITTNSFTVRVQEFEYLDVYHVYDNHQLRGC